MAQLDQAKVFIQIEEKQKRNPRKIQDMEREANPPWAYMQMLLLLLLLL